MAAEPHKWLADYLSRHLGELEGLGNSKRELKAARSWFNALLEYFRARHLPAKAAEELSCRYPERNQETLRRFSSRAVGRQLELFFGRPRLTRRSVITRKSSSPLNTLPRRSSTP
jgi:hypothetical protein